MSVLSGEAWLRGALEDRFGAQMQTIETAWRRFVSVAYVKLIVRINAESHRGNAGIFGATAMPRSLYLVHPEDLTLGVASEGGDFGPPRKRVRARFEFEGHSYCLMLTDPLVERLYLREPEGDYESEDAILCVSLAAPFHGDCYKLAAAVITKRRAEGQV